MAIQNLRSSSAHKRPIAEALSAGQIAINTNQASPGLFFKDSNGDLVKVGPVHIGTSAPNSSPATTAADALVSGTVYQILTLGNTDFTAVGASANTVGVVFTATGAGTGTGTVSGQQGVEKGEQWLDTTGGTYVLKIYDGTAWRSESGTFVDVNGDTMTGALGVVAGSASAPGVFFSGDTNTGLLSPGADSVAITTGGTQRIVVDSSGRVGIGETAPGAPLTIQSDTSANNTRLLGRSTGNRSDIQFYQNNGTSFMGSLSCQDDSMNIFLASSSGDLKYTASQHTFRDENGLSVAKIDSSGNLAVGDTATQSFRLKVLNGAGLLARFTDGTSQTLDIRQATGGIELQNPNNGFISFKGSSSERARFDSSGRLLVGASSARTYTTGGAGGNQKLQIETAGASSVFTTAGIYSNSDVAALGAYFELGRSKGTTLGSVTAVAQNDVLGEIRFAGTNGSVSNQAASISAHVDGAVSGGGASDMPGRLVFATSADGSSSPTSRMTIDSSGNVGIGTTSPARPLSVSSSQISARFLSSSSDSQIEVVDSSGTVVFGSASGDAIVQAGGYERLRIDSSSGDVGIGTTSNYDDSVLEVRKTAGGDGVAIRVTNNTTTDGSQAGIIFTNSTGDYTSAAIAHQRNDNALIFYNGQTAEGGGFANATERCRIDSSGRLLVGTTIARTDFYSGALSADIQIEDSSYCAYSAYVHNGNAAFIFGRGNPINGSIVGNLSWMADDGTDEVEAARISAQIDGTPGSNDMPGRLVFSTTEDGASSTTERMRIDSSGQVYIGATSGLLGKVSVRTTGTNDTLLHLATTGGSSNNGDATNSIRFTGGTNLRWANAKYEAFDHIFHGNGVEHMRIDYLGRLLQGKTSSKGSTGANIPTYCTEIASNNPNVLEIANNGTAVNSYSALVLSRSDSSSVNGHVAIDSGDKIGEVAFIGADGSDRFNTGAAIAAIAQADFTANNCPTHLTFSTNGGSATASERMRIQQNGQIYLSNCTDFYPLSDNSTGLGGAVNRWTAVYAANGTIQTSDSRQKTSVVDAQLGANFIKALRPVSYKWIEGGKRHTGEYDENNNWVYETVPGQRTHWGFIAQEVKQAVDDAGVDFGGWVLTDKDNPDSEQALRYDQFIAPLTKALQEAIAKIETLEQRLSDAGIA